MGRLDRFWEYIEVFHRWGSLNLNSKMGNFGLNSLNGLFGERIGNSGYKSTIIVESRKKPFESLYNILLIHFLFGTTEGMVR